MAEIKCPRCDGCGEIANSADGEPWSAWEAMPEAAKLPIREGLVYPLVCPACDGSGEQHVDELTFARLREANVDERLRACFHSLEERNALEWAGAMCGEVGELVNLCKKLRRPEPVPIDALMKEIGDTLIYLDLLAARLGLTLEECARYAFNAVSEKQGSEVRL